MLSWSHFAVLFVPGLGIYACGHRATGVLLGCSFVVLSVASADWRTGLAAWCLAQLTAILITLRHD